MTNKMNLKESPAELDDNEEERPTTFGLKKQENPSNDRPPFTDGKV